MKKFTFFLLTVLLFLGLQYGHAQAGGGKRPIPDGPQNVTANYQVTSTATKYCNPATAIRFNAAPLTEIPGGADAVSRYEFLLEFVNGTTTVLYEAGFNVTADADGVYGSPANVKGASTATMPGKLTSIDIVYTSNNGSLYLDMHDPVKGNYRLTARIRTIDAPTADCNYEASYTVTVDEKPELTIAVPALVCENDLVNGNFTLSNMTGIDSYTLAITGDVTTPATTNETHTAANATATFTEVLETTPAGTRTVNFAITNTYSGGTGAPTCNVNLSADFTVVDPIQITLATANKEQICLSAVPAAGEPINATLASGIVSGQILVTLFEGTTQIDQEIVNTDADGDATTSLLIPAANLATAGDKTFKVVARDAAVSTACNSEETVNIEVLSDVTIDIPDFYLCKGYDAANQATVTPQIVYPEGDATGYTYSYKEGTTEFATTAAYTFTGTGAERTIDFTVENDATGCKATKQFVVKDLVKPDMSVAYDPTACLDHIQDVVITDNNTTALPTDWSVAYSMNPPYVFSTNNTFAYTHATVGDDDQGVRLMYHTPASDASAIVNYLEPTRNYCQVLENITLTTVDAPTITFASNNNLVIIPGVAATTPDEIKACLGNDVSVKITFANLIEGVNYDVYTTASTTVAETFPAPATGTYDYIYEPTLTLGSSISPIRLVPTTDDLACEVTKQLIVTGLENPTPETIANFSLCDGHAAKATLALDNWTVDMGTATYTWTGATPTATEDNTATFEYDAAVRTVTAKAENTATGCSMETPFTISPQAAPIVEVTYESPVCEGYTQTVTVADNPSMALTDWTKEYQFESDVTVDGIFEDVSAPTSGLATAIMQYLPPTSLTNVAYTHAYETDNTCRTVKTIDFEAVDVPTITFGALQNGLVFTTADNDEVNACKGNELLYDLVISGLVIGEEYVVSVNIDGTAGPSDTFTAEYATKTFEDQGTDNLQASSTRTYTVKPTGTSALGCEVSATITINALNVPTITPIEDFALCNVNEFTATVTPEVNDWTDAEHGTPTYKWFRTPSGEEKYEMPNGGLSARSIDGSFGGGLFEVEVSNVGTGCKVIEEFNVTPFDRPVLDGITHVTPGCIGATQTITLSEVEPTTFPTDWTRTYAWTNAVATATPATDEATYTHSGAGNENVTGTLTFTPPADVANDGFTIVEYINADACNADEIATIETVAAPVITVTDNPICAEQPDVKLNVTGLIATVEYSIVITKGEGADLTEVERVTIDAGSTTYIHEVAYTNEEVGAYTATVTPGEGFTVACNAAVSYTVNLVPVIEAITANVAACEGNDFILTAEVENATSYEYTYNNGTSQEITGTITGNSFEQTFISEGDITYTLTVENEEGCSATQDFVYEQATQPVTLTGLEDVTSPICNNTRIRLEPTEDYAALAGTTQTYTWTETSGDWDGGSPEWDNVTDLTEYTTLVVDHRVALASGKTAAKYTLTVNTNGYNCPISATTNDIQIKPNFEFELEQSNDTICEGGSVDISFTVSHYNAAFPIYYRWLENGVYYNGDAYQQINAGSNVISMTTHPSLHESESGPESYEYSLEVWQNTGNPVFDACRGYSQPANVTVLTDPTIVITGPVALPLSPEVPQVYAANINGGHELNGEYTYKWYIENSPLHLTTQTIELTSANTLGFYGYANTHDLSVIVKQTASGCEFQEVLEVTVQSVATDDVHVTIAGPTSACVGDVVILNAVTDNENLDHHYIWYKNGNLITDSDENDVTLHVPITEEDTLTDEYTVVIHREGCDEYTSPVHQFQVIPTSQVLVEQQILCDENKTRVTANVINFSETVTYRYTWLDASDAVIDQTYVNYMDFDNAEAGTYKVKVELLNTACNPAVVEFTVDAYTATATPVVHLSSVVEGVSTICDGSLLFVFTTPVEGATYTWYRNGVVIEGANLATINEYPTTVDGDPTAYFYKVQITDANGCVTDMSAPAVAWVHPNPTVEVTGDPIVCHGGENNVVLQANVTSEEFLEEQTVYYQWYENNVALEDETFATLDVERIYSENPYSFSVEVSHSPAHGLGCVTRSDDFEVYVNDKIVVNASASANTICVGNEVTVYASLNNWNETNLTYQWSVNGVEQPGATQLSYTTTLETAGDYEFKVEINNLQSECTATSEGVTVAAVEAPAAPLIVTSTLLPQVCEGGLTTLTVSTALEDGLTYTWYRDGIEIEGANGPVINEHPEVVGGDPTVYLYNVKYSNEVGCVSAISLPTPLVVYPDPVVEIAGDPIVCADDEFNVNLNANVIVDEGLELEITETIEIENPLYPWVGDPTISVEIQVSVYDTEYQWYENGVAIEGQTDQILSITKPYREYPYSFTVEATRVYNVADAGLLGCTQMSDAFEVYVNDEIVVNATATESVVCVGGETTLAASLDNWNEADLTYQWSVNSAEIAGATELTYTTPAFDAEGTYNYTVEIISLQSQCEANSTAVAVEVVADPTLAIEANATAICDGGQVTLTATPTAASTIGTPVYTWFLNGEVIEGAVANELNVSPIAIDGDHTDYNYSASVAYTAAGCESTLSNTITVTAFANPTVEITGDAIVCESAEGTDNVILTANPFGVETNAANFTYQWFKNNVALAGEVAQELSIREVYSQEAILSYTVAIAHGSDVGCATNSDPFVVTVVDVMDVAVTTTDATICAGGEVTLSANLADWNETPLTYQWYNEAGAIAGATSLTHTAIVNATTTFKVVITNSESLCTAEGTQVITVVDDPEIDEITATETQICDGGQVTLEAHATIDAAAGEGIYTWYLNGEVIPNAVNATLVVSDLTVTGDVTVYNYSAKVHTALTGCESDVVPAPAITVVSNPSVYLVGPTNVVINPNNDVTYTANVAEGLSQEGIVYAWYINNVVRTESTSNTITIANTDVLYDAENTHEVKVIATQTNGGCVSEATMDVNVQVSSNDDVHATIEGPTSACEGSPVTLTAVLSNEFMNHNFQWFKNGNPIIGATEISYTFVVTDEYDLNDQYTVEVTREGCDAYMSPVHYFQVVPNAQVLITQTTICDLEEAITRVTADVVNFNEALTYRWIWLAEDGSEEITYVNYRDYRANGPFTVDVEILESACNPATTSFTVELVPVPAIEEIEANVNTICDGGEVTLTATSNVAADYAVYQWFLNGEVIPEAVAPVLVVSPLTVGGDVTTYTYTVKVTNTATGCISVESTEGETITVYANPTIEISGDNIVCDQENNITLTANVLNDSNLELTYQWYENNDPIDGATAEIFTTTEEAREYPYSYSVRVINGVGCTVMSESFEVTVTDNIDVTILASDNLICEGGEVTLTASIANWNETPLAYQWYELIDGTYEVIEGATSGTFTTVLEDHNLTPYTFKVVVNNLQAICVGEAFATIEIDVVADPFIKNIAVTENDTICEGGQITLTAESIIPEGIGTPIYTWFVNGEVIPNAVDAVLLVSPLAVDGDVTEYNYSAKVSTALSGCESNVKDAAPITVFPNPTIEISGDPIVCVLTENNVSLTANVLNDSEQELAYQWFENNSPIEGATEPTYQTTEEYRDYPYSYSVRVINEYGCTIMSESFEVYVSDVIVVNASISDTIICQGGATTFAASLNNWNEAPLTYQWAMNGVVIPGATGLTYTADFPTAGNFGFTVQITNLLSECVANSEADTVRVIAAPVITEIDINELSLCDGGQVTMTAETEFEGPGELVYTWLENGIIIPGATEQTILVSPRAIDTDTTHYHYAAYVMAPIPGCVSETTEAELPVVVGRNPVLQIDADMHICAGDVIDAKVYIDGSYNEGFFAPENVQYKWYIDGAMQYNGDNRPQHFASAPTMYTGDPVRVDFEYIGTNGCAAWAEPFFVTVHEAPVVNISATDTTICHGGEVTLMANLNDYNEDELQIQWCIGDLDNEIEGATQLTYTTELNATTHFFVKVYQRNSLCEDSHNLVINVVEDPSIESVTIDNATICEGGMVTLTANAINTEDRGAVTYTWFLNGEVVPNAVANVLTVSPLAVDGDVTTYNYSVKVSTSLTGCESDVFAASAVVVNPNATVEISGDPIVCVETPNNVSLTANVISALPVTYQWYENNAPIDGATASTYVTTEEFREYPYSYSVIVSNDLGCTVTSESFEVYVSDAIQVNAAASDATICAGGEVTVYASLDNWTETPLTYQWSVNGVEIEGATELSYTTTLNDVATYNYAVEIFNLQSECNATAEVAVEVVADPVVTSIDVTETTICEGGQVTLTANAINIDNRGEVSYTWFVNGEVIPNAVAAELVVNPMSVDNDATVYTYAVKVSTTLTGCESEVFEATPITVLRNPIVLIDGDQSICEGEPVYLAAFVDHESDVVGGISYTWYQQGQLRVENAPNPFYTEFWAPRTEPYTFTVEITRENGCRTMSPEFQVTVHENVAVNIRAEQDETTICEGGDVTLVANIDDYNMDLLTYQWFVETYEENIIDLGGGNTVIDIDTIRTNIAGATQAEYTTTVLTETTIFGVQVAQNDSECFDVATQEITVTPIPVVAVVVDPTTDTICSGEQVTFEVNTTVNGVAAEGVTYQWYVNGEIIPEATAAMYSTVLSIEGVYEYEVKAIMEESGCESIVTFVDAIAVRPHPTVNVVVTDSPIVCDGGTVELTANVLPTQIVENSEYVYAWYLNNVLIAGATAAVYETPALVANETAYNYHVVVVDPATGCEVTSTPVEITVLANPVATVTVDEAVICVGGEATFTANVEGGIENVNGIAPYTFQWLANGVEIAGATADTYTTTATAAGITTYSVVVENTYGCEVTATIEHEVVADPVVTVALAEFAPEQVCEGATTQLEATVEGGEGAIYTYKWFLNDVLIHTNVSGENNDVITTHPLSLTADNHYRVEVEMSGVGCNGEAEISLDGNVNELPTVAVAISEGTVCYGGTTTLTATVQDGIAPFTYQWFGSFNGGVAAPIEGANAETFVTEPYLNTGSYTYYVEVMGAGENCGAISGEVVAEVVADPTVTITGVNEICEGDQMSLTASIEGGIAGEAYTYTWSYQQGATEVVLGTTTENVYTLPAHLPANILSQPYLFTVVIEGTTTTTGHCNNVSATHAVQIKEVPTVNLTVDNSAICQGGTVTVEATVNPTGTYNYVWTVGGSEVAINAATIVRNNLPIGTTTFGVSVEETGASTACVATATVNVTVVADPVVTISSNLTEMCAGGTVEVSLENVNVNAAIPEGIYNYTWSRDGIQVPGVVGTTFAEQLNVPGEHTYALRVSHPDASLGCVSEFSAPVTVDVLAQPEVTITNPIADICVGGTVEATAYPTAGDYGYTYEWKRNNDAVVGTSANLSNVLNAIGTYSYTVTVESSVAFCLPAVSEASSVDVLANPTWTAAVATPNELCLGGMVDLTADIQGGVLDANGNNQNHIQWKATLEGTTTDVVGGLGGVTYDSPAAAGVYTYYPEYVGTIGSGCVLPESPELQVVVNALPEATLTIEGDNENTAVICANDVNSWANLLVTFAQDGTYTFDLVASTGERTAITTTINPFIIPVRPETTTAYWVENIVDATTGCEATANTSTVLVAVADAEIAHVDNIISTCGGATEGTVDIYFTSSFADESIVEFKYEGGEYVEYPVTNLNTESYITVPTPVEPGDHLAFVRINGCEFVVYIRVLISNETPGFAGLVELRWDDVLVVNNNPANNGGYTFTYFQWYKDGVAIPGANKQYYQEIGGINTGAYTVHLIGTDANGNTVEFATCDVNLLPTNLKVYPVPAHVSQPIVLEIDLTEEQLEGATLDIFDAKGAHIRNLPINSVVVRIDGFQAQGSYFGRITTGTNEVKTVKFVIVK